MLSISNYPNRNASRSTENPRSFLYTPSKVWWSPNTEPENIAAKQVYSAVHDWIEQELLP